VTDVAAPVVRMMPGSDVVSLELNVKGMTEPNKNFFEEESEELTQVDSQLPE